MLQRVEKKREPRLLDRFEYISADLYSEPFSKRMDGRCLVSRCREPANGPSCRSLLSLRELHTRAHHTRAGRNMGRASRFLSMRQGPIDRCRKWFRLKFQTVCIRREVRSPTHQVAHFNRASTHGHCSRFALRCGFPLQGAASRFETWRAAPLRRVTHRR